jgi:hypothetical protein
VSPLSCRGVSSLYCAYSLAAQSRPIEDRDRRSQTWWLPSASSLLVKQNGSLRVGPALGITWSRPWNRRIYKNGLSTLSFRGTPRHLRCFAFRRRNCAVRGRSTIFQPTQPCAAAASRRAQAGSASRLCLGPWLLGVELTAPQLRVDWRPLAPKSVGVPLPKPEVGFAFRKLGVRARQVGALTELLQALGIEVLYDWVLNKAVWHHRCYHELQSIGLSAQGVNSRAPRADLVWRPLRHAEI